MGRCIRGRTFADRQLHLDATAMHHPARATARRLPPSVARRAHPVAGCPDPTAVTRPLRASPITEPSTLRRGSPPLSGASPHRSPSEAPLAQKGPAVLIAARACGVLVGVP